MDEEQLNQQSDLLQDFDETQPLELQDYRFGAGPDIQKGNQWRQEFNERKYGSSEEVQGPDTTTKETDHLIVDGQDLRNHPRFEELNLQIPYKDDEGKPGYYEKYPEIYGNYSKLEAARISLERKHALTKEGAPGLEFANSVKKGGVDLISSVLTAPERWADMISGQMARKDGYMIDTRTGQPYKPDWDPMGNIPDPWQNSWWGKVTQGITHYGGGALLMRRLGVKNIIAQEGAFAAISEYSQGDNVTSQITRRVPWTEHVFGLIATKDDDHPVVVTFKNVLEEMGFAKLFDFILGRFGGERGVALAQARKNNVDIQIKEKGQQEIFEEINLDRQLTGETIDVDVLPPRPEVNAQRIKGKLPGNDLEDAISNVQKLVDETTDPIKKAALRADLNDLLSFRNFNFKSPEWLDKLWQNRSRYPQDFLDAIKGVKTKQELFKLYKSFKNRSRHRGHAHKPQSQPGQGSPNSTSDPFTVHQQLNRLDDNWNGTDLGSTGSVTTPAGARRTATTAGEEANVIRELAERYRDDPRFKDVFEEIKQNKRTVYEVFRPAFKRYQEMLGRDATKLTDDEFWKPILDDLPARTGQGPASKNFDYWSMENVVVADLVNGSLFKQLRDLSIAAREMKDHTDIWAKDGLMQSIEDRLIFGLKNVKRSRYLHSTEFSKLQTGFWKRKAKKASAQEISQRLDELHDETVDGVRMMMKMMKDSDSQELADGILEVFSMSNKIQNWADFDKWMRAKLWGGRGLSNISSNRTGATVRELQKMFVNSILSSVKTPARALIGTTSNTVVNQLQTLIGATARSGLTGDFGAVKSSAYSFKGLFEVIPESWQVMKTNLNAKFSGDMSTIHTRYTEPIRDTNWEVMGKWVEQNGNEWDKMAFRVGNIAKGLNEYKLFNWSPRVLAATDDTFRYIMARLRSKELAFREVMEGVEGGQFKEITPDLLRKAEDLHYQRYIDDAGDLDLGRDLRLDEQFKEVTLTKELQGFSKKLQEAFQETPIVKPFFLFARTGVNGLMMNAKNTPILGAILKESRDILTASPKNLDNVAQYGINNAADLAQAKNLIIGRQIMGHAVVMMAAQAKIEGRLTGNGPQDAQKRGLWEDTKWQRNTITNFGIQVGYETFEPYNTILSAVSDIADNMYLMGPDWAEDRLQMVSLAVMGNITSKSYLQGLSQFVELLTPSSHTNFATIAGNIANNQIPLSSLRNDASKILNPRMRELNSSITDSVRNRNLIFESIAVDPLEVKRDMLNGEPIRDWNLIEGFYNAISPITLRLVSNRGRMLLWNSNYNLRMSVMTSPTTPSISLRQNAKARGIFRKAIGQYRDHNGLSLEDHLNHLAKQPYIKASVKAMYEDIRKGNIGLPGQIKIYRHNQEIDALFKEWRSRAWAQPEVQTHPAIIKLKNEQINLIQKSQNRKFQLDQQSMNEAQGVLNLKNK